MIDQIFNNNNNNNNHKTSDCVRTKIYGGRIWVAVCVRVRVGVGDGVCSSVVGILFFFLLIILEAHVGHTSFPDLHTIS